MIIKLQDGSICGKKGTSILTNKPFYSFLGIPYAKPPVGHLRFEAPEAHSGWDGILDATTEGNACMQYDTHTGSIIGSEDCLFLNVYTPKIPCTNDKIPVMVYIHGGAFSNGSAGEAKFAPDYLINYDVILVTINYRLSIFGFLNLNTPGCPGNAGLKDQLLALKWIKKNIKSFGGDDENITLFGESAGAASAHFLLISPLSEGLFHRCIFQSGSGLDYWATAKQCKEVNEELAKLLQFELSTDLSKFCSYLKSVEAEKLFLASTHVLSNLSKECGNYNLLGFYFLPSVEVVKEGAFLPDDPRVLMKSAKPLPVITGINDKEALFVLKILTPEILLNSANNFLAEFLEFSTSFKKDSSQLVAQAVKEFYFKNKIVDENDLDQVIDLHSDLAFGNMLYSSLDFISNSCCPLYVYYFTFDGDYNYRKKNIFSKYKHLQLKGASHGDELNYLFYGTLFPAPVSGKEPELTVIKNLCSLWTNFAKTGNPNGENVDVIWNPSKLEDARYLQIDSKLVEKQGRVEELRRSFWEKMNELYMK